MQPCSSQTSTFTGPSNAAPAMYRLFARAHRVFHKPLLVHMISETWGVGMHMYLRAIGFKHAVMGVSAAARSLFFVDAHFTFCVLCLHSRPGTATTESLNALVNIETNV